MNKLYRIKQFGERIGKSVSTLRRWDNEGKLKAKRTISGHRYYDESDVRRVLRLKEPKGKTVVYCRVSSKRQKDDLQSQVTAMESFCLGSGTAIDEWIQEYGGGMNFKRKKFLSIAARIMTGDITKLIIAHKDRFCRFGFEYFEHMAEQNGCKIIVVNQEALSPQQEMVEDLMSIVHTFSCRLYGLRKYKKAIEKMVKDNK